MHDFEPATRRAVASGMLRAGRLCILPARAARHRAAAAGPARRCAPCAAGRKHDLCNRPALFGGCGGAGGAQRPGPRRRAGCARCRCRGIAERRPAAGPLDQRRIRGPARRPRLDVVPFRRVHGGCRRAGHLQGGAAGGARRAGPGRCRHFVAGMAGRRASGAARRRAGDRPGDDRQPAPGCGRAWGGGFGGPDADRASQPDPGGRCARPGGVGLGAGIARQRGAGRGP